MAFDAFSQQPPAWVLESFGPAGPDGTWGGLSLEDVIHDFGGEHGEEEHPEDFIDLSDLAQIREHGFYV